MGSTTSGPWGACIPAIERPGLPIDTSPEIAHKRTGM